jgi:hypothetical protein
MEISVKDKKMLDELVRKYGCTYLYNLLRGTYGSTLPPPFVERG